MTATFLTATDGAGRAGIAEVATSGAGTTYR